MNEAKYQWSKTKNDEMVVLCTDSWTEFQEKLPEMRKVVEVPGGEEITPSTNRTATNNLGNCPRCGAANKLSKSTGKIYCGNKCWLR